MSILRTIAPYAIAVGIVAAILFGAYWFGVEVTTNEYTGRISQIEADAATKLAKANADLASMQAKYRAQERDNTENMSAVDAAHQQAIHDTKITFENTIAGLRAGTIRLRGNLAASEFAAAGSSLPSTGTGTGQRDAAKGVGLQQADAELVLRIASEADAVADQLRACQAVVRADRKGQ
jgi:prophage endopeptidase